MTSVLKKSKGTKGKSVSMQEDLPSRWDISHKRSEDVAELIKFIDESIVGKGNSFCGPYGRRKVVYCDYSGSGRALLWLEEHVSRHVLPAHGTQCTALAHASAQQLLYREESRTIIRTSVCASADDVVVLGASLPRLLRALRPPRPTVFVSSRETERQLAPWKECHAEIIKIPESKEGFIDLNNLEQRLQENSGNGKPMIGFFAAASKLTGVLADDVATTLLLHQYGAWAFWDYTLVAPYTGVDMNPTFPGVEEEMVKKDVVLFNCEKFVGGVQGPNVAVAKKEIFKNTTIYCDDVEMLSERLEEWRCVDAVRAALVVRLRDAVGIQNIAYRQDYITRQVLAHIKNIPELILLGSESPTARRLPIFSLMVKHPRGTFLHHNFICAVLNDVFGIQARGGLSSNLAYGEDVLGIDNNLLKEYEKLLDVQAQKEIARVRKISDVKAPDIPIHNEHMRPGFFRISLPFFMSESELAFVLEALKMVATEGWKILPQYTVNSETGHWKHHTNSVLKDRKSLYSVRFHDGKMTANDRKFSGPGIFPQTYTECLQTARNLFNRARKLAMKCPIAEPEMSFNPRIDYLRWFMLPKEAHDLLLGKSANVKQIVPFDPSGYTGARKSLINRSSAASSPTLGSSPRHFSLSALDDCQILRLKHKQKFYSRESSLKEHQKENTNAEAYKPAPVHFVLGDSMSPIHLSSQTSIPHTILARSRCYSLGSDSPQAGLSPDAKLNLGLKESSPNVISEKSTSFCHCGSQTDLLSLDDAMILPSLPTKTFPYSGQNSMTDFNQYGRSSPTVSLGSHNSEDLHAYVKEMTKEIATEIKSEIREVISQVDDILENSDAIEQSNLSINSTSSQGDRNSVSITDVAEYLMGMSKEMASEVKHEIREMVNQVDEMISPDYNGAGSRKSSPPHTARSRIGSGPDLGLDLKKTAQRLRKCPTSPILPLQYTDDDRFCKNFPLSSTQSPKSAQRTPPQEVSGPNSISFNSSETSTPDTIIQVETANQNSPNLPKSLSSNKLSDDEAVCCSDVTCRNCCMKKIWCQNPSVSSQDSGINMTFTETDSYLDFGKWRTSSDPTTKKSKELQGRLRMCPRHEKNEVPDIIEGVPVCASQPVERRACRQEQTDIQAKSSITEMKRSNRSSNASSISSDRSSRSSGYGTDVQRLPVQDEHDSDDAIAEYKCPNEWCELGVSGNAEDDSSACSDTSLSEFTCDDAPWHCPPKRVWKPALEAITEYNMIRPGDKVLVCLSGCRESIALLHTLHHYRFYSRSKGIHFTIGALFVHEPRSEVDPLHLMAYCRTLGVKLIYQDKLEDTELNRRSVTKPCEVHRWASHAVRRRAYAAASSHGYHVAAVAQHLDDAARAFLANAFHCGTLRTMKAHYRVREHELRIIRPLIYVRESDLDRFACARRLPDFRADCVMHEIRERTAGDSDESGADDNKETTGGERSTTEVASPIASARQMLEREEHLHPGLFASLKRALHPLVSASNIEKDLKERHRKKSVIQMKNGAPVYDSDEGTDEEPVP